MALVMVRGTERVLEEPGAIEHLLAEHGYGYHFWGDDRMPSSLRRTTLEPAQQAQVLELYGKEIAEVSRARGYAFADVVWVAPDNPRLLEIERSIGREHTHEFDELRLVVNGHATYTVRGNRGEAIDVTMGSGDFLAIPAEKRHWTSLLADRSAMVVRLLRDEKHRAAPFRTYYQGTGCGPTEIPREYIVRAFGEAVVGAKTQ